MNVIIDTREKEPWDFKFWGCKQTVTKLDYGDYSIRGLEDVVVIERKKSLAELSINLGKKRKQFLAELELLAKVQHPYMLCEFARECLDTFPVNSGIPKKMWPYLRMNRGFIISSFSMIEEMGIPIIFSFSKEDANLQAYEILKDVYENN
jgi:hypothetical protein